MICPLSDHGFKSLDEVQMTDHIKENTTGLQKEVLDIGRTFRTQGDEFCPWDSRLYFPRTEQNPDNFIDGKGNINLSGEGSSRFFVLGE